MTDGISTDAVVIERVFDAPVDVIWKMWTEAEHFSQWYGPHGFSVPLAEMDVQIGGKRRTKMESADGSMVFWTTGEFLEVMPNQRLVYTDNFADEDGNMLPAPGGDDLMMTQVTVVFEALDGQTKITMTHAGFPSQQAQHGASGGWNQAFEKMDAHIETMLGR